MTHDDLIHHARKWLARPFHKDGHGSTNRGGCPIIVTEMTSSSRETPDAIGWYNGRSYLVECKASRADFNADPKKSFRKYPEKGVGDYRYFMTPRGLVDDMELPDGWGLLEVEGDRIFFQRVSDRFDIDVTEERTMLLSLIRRLNVQPEGHIKIKHYTIDDEKDPRATFTREKGVGR